MSKRPDLTRARTALGAAALVLLGAGIGDHALPAEQRAAVIVLAVGVLAYLARSR